MHNQSQISVDSQSETNSSDSEQENSSPSNQIIRKVNKEKQTNSLCYKLWAFIPWFAIILTLCQVLYVYHIKHSNRPKLAFSFIVFALIITKSYINMETPLKLPNPCDSFKQKDYVYHLIISEFPHHSKYQNTKNNHLENIITSPCVSYCSVSNF